MTVTDQQFLLEIGTEELPSSWIEPALARIADRLRQGLADLRIRHGRIRTMGTPRRLVALVDDVAAKQEDAMREDRGPPKSACFDKEGNPTKALTGFAASKGVAVEDIELRADERGEYAFAKVFEEGKPTTEALAGLLPEVALAPSFPKTMRWGSGRLRYGRPLQWLLALLGDEPVPCELDGLRSSSTTRGHRTLGDQSVPVPGAGSYLSIMAAQHVVVDHGERRESIREQVEKLAIEAGGEPLFLEELLDENLHLVENPTALLGSFPDRYLALPDVVLTTVMRKHQKYFPLATPEGKLLPRFIAIRDGDDHDLDTVRRGNEWVLIGRLDDGKFSYEEDRKRKLADGVAQLARVTFMEGLGTLDDKRQRLIALSEHVASEVGLDDGPAKALARAAQLCKVDLATRLVIEFTSLQGIVGGLYAAEDGEPEAAAAAIRDHYLPTFIGDDLPATIEGCVLSIADKMDHVVGCISLGLMPKGSGDPQGLRRRTQAMAAIVMERRLPVDLMALFEAASAALGKKAEELRPSFTELLEQRVHAVLERHAVVPSVRAAAMTSWDDLHTAIDRAQLLAALIAEMPEDFADATRGATRVGNIVGKRASDRTEVKPQLFDHETEAPLLAAIEAMETALVDVPRDAWRERITVFAKVAPAVDALFDGPMVMAEDPELRDNRLAMLYRCHRCFVTVANFARLELPESE